MIENLPTPTVRELLSFRPLPRLSVVAQIAILVGLYVAYVGVCYWSVRTTGTLGGYPSDSTHLIFAPIYEEVLFRGVIFGSLLGS